MPWRLIGFLIILTLFVIFSGFNTQPITINVGPVAFPNIPLFVALVATFILGAFTALPFAILKSVRNRKKQKEKKISKMITTPKTKEPPEEQPLLTENVTEVDKVTKVDKKKRSRSKK